MGRETDREKEKKENKMRDEEQNRRKREERAGEEEKQEEKKEGAREGDREVREKLEPHSLFVFSGTSPCYCHSSKATRGQHLEARALSASRHKGSKVVDTRRHCFCEGDSKDKRWKVR
jgi:hypothetical protein